MVPNEPPEPEVFAPSSNGAAEPSREAESEQLPNEDRRDATGANLMNGEQEDPPAEPERSEPPDRLRSGSRSATTKEGGEHV